MPFEATINKVRATLVQTAVEVDRWFDRPQGLQEYRPLNGGWSISQILEHVTLTNRFLLLTCEKHVRIALHRAARGDEIPNSESDLERMASIGERGSFRWVRPKHMEPTGSPTAAEVRTIMSEQWRQCQNILNMLDDGKGALCQVTMTVNQLGKIDLYQWLYFAAMHANRHVQQMVDIDAEYETHEAARRSNQPTG